MMPVTGLEELVQELSHLFDEKTALTGTRTRSILYPPATVQEIDEFERTRKLHFPPSYRSFLLRHNGWVNYLDVYTLIGVSGSHTKKALNSIAQDLKIFMRRWAQAKRPTDEEFIKGYEAKGAKHAKNTESAHLYLPTKIHFGTDYAGSLFFFNPNQTSNDGEMEVIERFQTGALVGRHLSFTHMLEAHLNFTRKKIASLQKGGAP